jgi:AcrR family transcriptional regulator
VKEQGQVGRVARRRAIVREKLLKSAYSLMSKVGVEKTSIQDVTNLADVGYGTFFNHFKTKDELTLSVIDCLIANIGRRNDISTIEIKTKHPAEVVCRSVRLVIRELVRKPIWGWLLLRPDILVSRMRTKLYPFGMRDFKVAIKNKRFIIANDEVDIGWSVLIWILAGCAKDIQDGYISEDRERVYSELSMRAMGVSLEDARRLSKKSIPDLPELEINFSNNEAIDGITSN